MAFDPFLTPEDAQNAFYAALERGSLEEMMKVWAEDEDVVCIHPQGPRLRGYEAVRDGWRRIFSGNSKLRVQVSHQQHFQQLLLAVFVVHENIVVEKDKSTVIVATNVFLQTDQGWKMLIHHASVSPAAVVEEAVPQVLH